MDFTELVSPLVSALVAVFGAYQSVKRIAEERDRRQAEQITRLETKMDVLSERVERHNSVMERTTALETEVVNLYHRLDDMKKGA